MEGVLAVVTCFAGNFTPRGWQFCNGQLLAITSNQALFSLLGTTYGGDGRTTFGLPQLQSRVPIGTGQGAGLPNVTLGQVAGVEKVTLTAANLPPHVHNGPVNVAQQCNTNNTDQNTDPGGSYLTTGTANSYGTTATSGQYYKAGVYTATIQTAGSSMPVSILEPYIAVYYIICTQGIFPSRN